MLRLVDITDLSDHLLNMCVINFCWLVILQSIDAMIVMNYMEICQ